MIELVPHMAKSPDGELKVTDKFQIFRDRKCVGFGWKGEPPKIAMHGRGLLSESDVRELTVILGSRPIIRQPPRVTPADWKALEKRIRAR